MGAEPAFTERAANLRRAADHNRLLPGELPQTPFSDDVQHWIRVYTDLLSFNQEMLEGMRNRFSLSTSPDGLEQADVDLMRAHIRRLRWRLRFWQRRSALLGPVVDQEPSQPGVSSLNS